MLHCAEAVVCETYLACWYTERDGQDASPVSRVCKVRAKVGINDNREFARHFLENRFSRNVKNLIDRRAYKFSQIFHRVE